MKIYVPCSEKRWINASVKKISPVLSVQACATRYNSADSLPTSNIKEVAILTTFSHVINIAELIYYTCSFVTDIQYTCYKNAFKNSFCVKTTLLRSIPNKFM